MHQLVQHRGGGMDCSADSIRNPISDCDSNITLSIYGENILNETWRNLIESVQLLPPVSHTNDRSLGKPPIPPPLE